MEDIFLSHSYHPLSIATAYLSVVGDHELQENAPCYKAQIISKRVWLSCTKLPFSLNYLEFLVVATKTIIRSIGTDQDHSLG